MYQMGLGSLLFLSLAAAVYSGWQAVKSLESSATWLGVAATLFLVAFAVVQLILQDQRNRSERREQGHRIHTLARLLRRNCDAAVASAATHKVVDTWAKSTGQARVMNRLEEQFLELQALAAEFGEDEAEHGRSAFEAFLDAADIINPLADHTVRQSLKEQGELQARAIHPLNVASERLRKLYS